jgi:hypothetical protein
MTYRFLFMHRGVWVICRYQHLPAFLFSSCREGVSRPYVITWVDTCTCKFLLPLERALSVQSKLKTLDNQSVGGFLPAYIILLHTFDLHWLVRDSIYSDFGYTLNRLVLSIGVDRELLVGDRKADICRRT